MRILQDKINKERDFEEKSSSESVTGEQSAKSLQQTTSNDQLKENIGSLLFGKDEISNVYNNMMRNDEKISSDSFMFDMQVLIS